MPISCAFGVQACRHVSRGYRGGESREGAIYGKLSVIDRSQAILAASERGWL
jgi:hypothetical protein